MTEAVTQRSPQPIANRVTHIANAVVVLTVLALIVTSYLIYKHFAPAGNSFCDLSAKLNCTAVSQSVYSQFLGIPVAILGFVAYALMLFIALKIRKAPVLGKRGRWSHLQWLQALMTLAGLGTAFSLYLTYIEAFVLRTWCIMCVIQQIIVLTIFILSLVALGIINDDVKERKVCEYC